jgi:hypothetical protein
VFRGLGHITNMPMYMSHKGAMYNTILMNIVDNPDGVTSKKQIMLDLCSMILNFYKIDFIKV